MSKVKKLRKILWPFSLLYDAVTRLRNHAFDKGSKPSKRYPLPLICVGNLSTGGTGKSPMVEYLLRLLADSSTAVISRGYGRKTKGLLEVTSSSNSMEVGDEPLQFKLGFPSTKVVVSEKRVIGVDYVLEHYPDTQVVLLDDAFQHRYVKAGLNIMLSSYHNLFYKDYVLPAGDLRENRKGAHRAQVIVVSKCPDTLSSTEAARIKAAIANYSTAVVFFSSVAYTKPVNRSGQHPEPGQAVDLLTGIAFAQPLKKHIAKEYTLHKHWNFKDHHAFTEGEISAIEQALVKEKTTILSTQKDFMRIKDRLSEAALKQLFVVSIKTHILFEEADDLNTLITNYIRS